MINQILSYERVNNNFYKGHNNQFTARKNSMSNWYKLGAMDEQKIGCNLNANPVGVRYLLHVNS